MEKNPPLTGGAGEVNTEGKKFRSPLSRRVSLLNREEDLFRLIKKEFASVTLKGGDVPLIFAFRGR